MTQMQRAHHHRACQSARREDRIGREQTPFQAFPDRRVRDCLIATISRSCHRVRGTGIRGRMLSRGTPSEGSVAGIRPFTQVVRSLDTTKAPMRRGT